LTRWQSAPFSSYRKEKEYYKLRRTKEECPFFTLGLTEEPHPKDIQVDFTTVKRTFLRVAMSHHPDTTDHDDDDESREIFIKARKAFEAIVEGPGGLAILRSESDAHQEEENMDAWFRAETGHDMPFMDAATMKEVAEMTDTVGGGLDRDGGMWTLARMVTSAVKSGGNANDILQLEAGEGRNPSTNGILRRRRKR
jgi:hypothetical protein